MRREHIDTLINHSRESVRQLAGQFSAGDISAGQFGHGMLLHLQNWHTLAFMLGRSLAGDRSPLDRHDQDMGKALAMQQAQYLSPFVQDLQEGSYATSPDDIIRRGSMYVDRLYGTMNEAWLMAQPKTSKIYWRMSVAEHCTSCQSLWKGSPYLPADLKQVPSDGQTECIVKCKCFLQSSSGAIGPQKPGAVPLPPGQEW